MARFLVGSTALTGHIVPLAPIVAELTDRGHQVLWYTGIHFQERVERAGATFVPTRFAADDSHIPVNDRLPNRSRWTGIDSLLFDIRFLFAAESAGHFLDLQDIASKNRIDAVLTDTGFLGGGWLYEAGGPPWAAFNPFAVNLSGEKIPPFGLGVAPPQTRLDHLRFAINQSTSWKHLYRDTTAYVDQLRQRVGLPETGQIFWDRSLSPYLYMQGSIRGLEYERDDLPPQFHYIGPTVSQAIESPFEPPAWWTDTRNYARTILVTQGTLSTDPHQLLLPTIRALASRNCLVIATTGGAPVEELTQLRLPGNCRVVEYIPFEHVLPHVDLMITNGGYNGVQLALSHGVPLVVAGATEDKLEINARIRRSGAGVDLGTSSPGPDSIRKAVMSILAENSYRQRAGELSREFRRHNGAATGADLLEALARSRRPILSQRNGVSI